MDDHLPADTGSNTPRGQAEHADQEEADARVGPIPPGAHNRAQPLVETRDRSAHVPPEPPRQQGRPLHQAAGEKLPPPFLERLENLAAAHPKHFGRPVGALQHADPGIQSLALHGGGGGLGLGVFRRRRAELGQLLLGRIETGRQLLDESVEVPADGLKLVAQLVVGVVVRPAPVQRLLDPVELAMPQIEPLIRLSGALHEHGGFSLNGRSGTRSASRLTGACGLGQPGPPAETQDERNSEQ